MDEQRIKLEARLLVIEHVLANVMRRQYALMQTDGSAVLHSHDRLLERMRETTIPGIDPTLSDLWSAELEDAAQRFVAGLEQMMGLERNQGRD